MDKGKTLVRKLGQKIKVEDKNDVKLEEVPEPSKEDCEHQQLSNDNKDKISLFTKKEGQPVQDRVTAETFSEKKTVATEKIAVKEENIQAQQRSPITILSEDEGYLLEEDEFTIKTETRVGSCREFSSLEEKTVTPKKRKTKVKV